MAAATAPHAPLRTLAIGFFGAECQEPMVEPYILFEALGLRLGYVIRAAPRDGTTIWNHE